MFPIQRKAQKHFKLIGAEIQEVRPLSVIVQATLSDKEVRQMAFPVSQVIIDGVQLYVTGWVITRRNAQLRSQGRGRLKFSTQDTVMA